MRRTDMAMLDDIEVERALVDALDIGGVDLDEDFKRFPSVLAYWNERAASAIRHYLMAKIESERVWAKLFKKFKRGEEKLSEKMIDAEICLHPEYLEAKENEAVLQAERHRLLGVAKALERKGDMLVSYGARQRTELEHDPSIRRRRRDMHEEVPGDFDDADEEGEPPD